MEFLGVITLLVTLFVMRNALSPDCTILDVRCTLTLHYVTVGDTPCKGSALKTIVQFDNKPVITWNDGTPAGDDETYVLFMVDPDDPLPCLRDGYLFLWVTAAILNAATKQLEYAGKDILGYAPPAPHPTSPAHRFQVLLYRAKIARISNIIAEFNLTSGPRLNGIPLSKYLIGLGLKEDEPPLASYQFCSTSNSSSQTCVSTGQEPTTTPGGGPTQSDPTSKPTSDSRIVKSVFQKNTLVLVYSVVIGWMNS